MELQEDQFSFKRLVLKCLLVIPYVKKNRKVLSIGAFVGLLVGGGYEYYKIQDVNFKTEIIFVVDGDNGGSGGGLLELANSFGLGGGLGTNASLFSGENFKELLKTKSIFRKALLTKVRYGNKEDFFVNIFLDKSRIGEFEWKSRPADFYNYRFVNTDINNLSVEDRNILDALYDFLKGQTVIANDNPKSTFQTLTVETRDDTLSYIWAKLYLKTVTNFYIDTKTKKSQELLVLLGKRVDSLRSALYYTQGKLANYNDQNQQIIFQRARIIAERLQLSSQQLQGMYLESVRNYDNLKFSLAKETPLFTIISEPEISPMGKRHFYGPITLIGIILGVFLSSFVLNIIRIYKEMMSK
jgi:hypothetical protein